MSKVYGEYVTAHRKQVSSAAGNWTFWRFENTEKLLNSIMDLYEIGWQ